MCFKCFNPRAHAGRDDYLGIAQPAFYVSIHAPTRGATLVDLLLGSFRKAVSIHAPTRGATLAKTIGELVDMFQSTRPRGARRERRRQKTLR
mgnify:CR=1 FL=1